MIDRSTLLFFDASCLIAAAGSPTGGSGFLLSLCARKFLRGVVSQAVLLEAERNVQAKLGEDALRQYHALLRLVPLRLVAVPQLSSEAPWRTIVNGKDAHVMTAALAAGAPFLLTLDKKLAEQVNQSGLLVQALSPGDFIRTILPTHTDYP